MKAPIVTTLVEGVALGVMVDALGLHGWRVWAFAMSFTAIIIAQYAEVRLSR